MGSEGTFSHIKSSGREIIAQYDALFHGFSDGSAIGLDGVNFQASMLRIAIAF